MLEVEKFVSGRWATNCYVLYDERRNALCFDPGRDTTHVIAFIRRHSLNLRAILITHAHYDHVEGIRDVAQAFGAPAYLNSKDAKLLSRMNLFRSIFDKEPPLELPRIQFDLFDTSKLEFESLVVDVFSTPGHTEGGVCFAFADRIFTGDTLLDGTIGRIDLPGGSKQDLQMSLTRIFEFPEDTVVYPGHGSIFRLGDFPRAKADR